MTIRGNLSYPIYDNLNEFVNIIDLIFTCGLCRYSVILK